jgi:hypothetical protein
MKWMSKSAPKALATAQAGKEMAKIVPMPSKFPVGWQAPGKPVRAGIVIVSRFPNQPSSGGATSAVGALGICRSSGACDFGGRDSTTMPRRWRWERSAGGPRPQRCARPARVELSASRSSCSRAADGDRPRSGGVWSAPVLGRSNAHTHDGLECLRVPRAFHLAVAEDGHSPRTPRTLFR